MHLAVCRLAAFIFCLGIATVGYAEEDQECSAKIKSEYGKNPSKAKKVEMLKRIRKECVRQGSEASPLYLDCKALRTRQIEAGQEKKKKRKELRLGLAECRKLESMISGAPKDGNPCETKACVRKGANDICVFSFTAHGTTGPDTCKRWIALKICSSKQDELNGVYPNLVQWKAGTKNGEAKCDEI